MLSQTANAMSCGLQAPTDGKVTIGFPALKSVLARLSPWKSKKDFSFNIVAIAETNTVFFVMHDPMLNNVVCLSVVAEVSADCFISVEFARFQQATLTESQMKATFADVSIRTKKTVAKLAHNEVLPSVERRLVDILRAAAQQKTTLPQELWPFLRAATKRLLLDAYMESRASLLDMYIKQHSDSKVAVSVSDDHHCCVSFITTENPLDGSVVFPQKSLQTIGAVFPQDDSSIDIFTDVTGIFFVSEDAFLYLPQARENETLYAAPAEFVSALREDDDAARVLIDTKDFRAGVDFVHAMVSEQRSGCTLSIDSELSLSRTSKSVGGGSYTVDTLRAKGAHSVNVDVRLLKEACDILRSVSTARISIHSEAMRNCISVSFSDEFSSTWYVAGSQSVEN